MQHRRPVILFAYLWFCFTDCSSATAQTFEAASVKPASQITGVRVRPSQSGGPGSTDPTLFTASNWSLTVLIVTAYDLKYYQFSGLPWMDSSFFDVVAKVPQGATREQFLVTLQNLLADRFKLKVHRESKEIPLYQLVIARNGQTFSTEAKKPGEERGTAAVAPSPGRAKVVLDENGFPILQPGGPPMLSMPDGHARMRATQETMEQFVNFLSFQVEKPVVNGTGLTGRYDFILSWVGNPSPSIPAGAVGAEAPNVQAPSGLGLMGALQKQLGLRLESRKGPIDILVVDHAERDPTVN
jgi:uncharacterized protein (TIGR03435 family)